MHSGSNEDFVTLFFPFGFNSQEKYGITSSATSKSGKEKANGREEGYGSYCSCVPRCNMHALPQCTSAEAVSWDSSLTI